MATFFRSRPPLSPSSSHLRPVPIRGSGCSSASSSASHPLESSSDGSTPITDFTSEWTSCMASTVFPGAHPLSEASLATCPMRTASRNG